MMMQLAGLHSSSSSTHPPDPVATMMMARILGGQGSTPQSVFGTSLGAAALPNMVGTSLGVAGAHAVVQPVHPAQDVRVGFARCSCFVCFG